MHLPDMDIERIATSVLPRMARLTEEQVKLNAFGRPIVFCCNVVSDLGDSLFKEYSSHASGEEHIHTMKVEKEDEMAAIAKAVEAIPNHELKSKGNMSSVAAYLVPHDTPELDFSIRGDDVGYDPGFQAQGGNKQRFGGLASHRRTKILSNRRELLKEAQVMGRIPGRIHRSGRHQPQPSPANPMNQGMNNMFMKLMSNLMNQNQRENPRRARHRMRDEFQQMSIPSPVSMGHGRQPYQSVMKSHNRGEHSRHGEPDPDADMRQNWNGPSNSNHAMLQQMQQMMLAMMEQRNGFSNQDMPPNSPMSQLQKMTMLMQQMGLSSPQNGMGMGLPQQYLHMMQQQQIQQQQQQQQQQMMQNMLQMMQSQHLATTCSDYGSDDSGMMGMNMNQGMGMNGMGSGMNNGMGSGMNNGMGSGMSNGMNGMGNGFNNVGSGMNGMGNSMGSPMASGGMGMDGFSNPPNQPYNIDTMMNAMSSGATNSPRFASPSPMDSPAMSAHSFDLNAPAETFQSPRPMTPTNNFGMQNMASPRMGMGMNGYWQQPNSPQANAMNMGMQQQQNMQQNMNPMPAGMNQAYANNPNMQMQQMLNNQTSSQNGFQNNGYVQQNQNVNNHQTRI